MAPQQPRRPKRVTVYYTQHGEGNRTDPATITFNFQAVGPSLAAMKENAPDTVEIEYLPDGRGYVMRGKNPNMSRPDLLRAFTMLSNAFGWETGSRL